MTQKYSPWFPPKIKPVHVGPYETRIYGVRDSYIRIWNLTQWMVPEGGSDGPLLNQLFPCCEQNRSWRGLARKP